MEMLSNGYGCIKKRSKTLKQSLFDWMLHKFNSLLIRTMSDVPTASTSTSTSTSISSESSSESASCSGSSISTPLASSSLSKPNEYLLVDEDLDSTTSDDSNSSSDEESETVSTASYEHVCTCEQNDHKHRDDSSWTSSSSTTVSCAGSDNSDTERTTVLKEMIREAWSDQTPVNDINTEESKSLLVLVQMREVKIEVVHVEEHVKRLHELDKEIEFIESTDWMYRPLDPTIRSDY